MSDKKRTVKIDDKEYDLDALSNTAKAQLTNIRITDAEIRQLQVRLGIAQTARAVYVTSLKAELEKSPE
jgi:hypothetical protein